MSELDDLEKQAEARANALELQGKAEQVALDLVEHAKETARQMLLKTNLDISQIPRICDDIRKIKTDLAANTIATTNAAADTDKIAADMSWLKWIAGAVGAMFTIIILPILGYLAILTIENGQQLAAVAATLKDTHP